MLVAKSYCRETASVAEGLPGRRHEYDKSETEFGYPATIAGTNKMALKNRQRRSCPKLMLTLLTCDYLTALVILAVTLGAQAAV